LVTVFDDIDNLLRSFSWLLESRASCPLTVSETNPLVLLCHKVSNPQRFDSGAAPIPFSLLSFSAIGASVPDPIGAVICSIKRTGQKACALLSPVSNKQILPTRRFETPHSAARLWRLFNATGNFSVLGLVRVAF